MASVQLGLPPLRTITTRYSLVTRSPETIKTARTTPSAGIPALGVVLAVLMVSGLLVTNEYRVVIVRNGGNPNWTDAIFRLADYMKGVSPSNVFCVDWGIMDSLRLLSRGKLPLRVGTDPITKPALDTAGREFLARTILSLIHI